MLLDAPDLHADDLPLPEGEVVIAPLPSGGAVTLRFASAYEPWLSFDGRRVVEDTSPAHRAVLIWASRRKTALYRVLDVLRGVRATLTSTGFVVVTDLIQLDDGSAADHGTLAAELERARVKTLPFATLGDGGHRIDVQARARSLYAAGTPIELRVEERGQVVSRRRWRVGR